MYVLDFLKAICIVLLLLFIGLFFEKIFNPKADLKGCVYQLKSDIWTVIKALISKEELRHIFDVDLSATLRRIVEPFMAVGLDIVMEWGLNANVPCIHVQFVPNKVLNEQELQKVSDLLKIAFRRYLKIKNLRWPNFAYYVVDADGVSVYICYAEHKEDAEPFKKKYRETVTEKVGVDFGCLRDPDLDKELNSISCL